eukprot:31180_1
MPIWRSQISIMIKAQTMCIGSRALRVRQWKQHRRRYRSMIRAWAPFEFAPAFTAALSLPPS